MSEPAENMNMDSAPVESAPEAPAVQAVPDTPAESDWRSSLPDDLRENPTIKDTPDIQTLAKRLVDSRSQLGNSIRIPGADAPQEDWDKFHQKLIDRDIGLTKLPDPTDTEAMTTVYDALGRPKEVSEYHRPEEWAYMTDERFGALAAKAHEAGLTKRQFETLVNSVSQMDNQFVASAQEQRQSEINQLKGEWGRAFEQKSQRAAVIAKQLNAPQPLQEALAAGDVDAATLRWMDDLASKFGGEGNGLVSGEGAVSEYTPNEVREQMNEITRKMLGMNQSDPSYKILMDKRLKLAELLHNE